MSGYHALRPVSHEESSASAYARSRPYDGDDMPIVLACVTDFRDVPDEPCDEPVADAQPAETETSPARVSRLAIAALVVVAGLCGFMLGRVTSSHTTADSESWGPAPPAPSAPEAPTWESRSLTPPASPTGPPRLADGSRNERSGQAESSSPPPSWTTPPAGWSPATPGDAAPVGPGARRQGADPAAERDSQTWLSANRAVTLPDGHAAAWTNPADRRVPQSGPYDARMACRPITPSQTPARPNVPPASNGRPAIAADRVGVSTPSVSHRMGGNPGATAASAPGVSGQPWGGPGANYPTTDYPTTSYPTVANPWANQAAGRAVYNGPPAVPGSSEGTLR